MSRGTPEDFPASNSLHIEQLECIAGIEFSREAFLAQAPVYFSNPSLANCEAFHVLASEWLSAIRDYHGYLARSFDNLPTELALIELVADQFIRDDRALNESFAAVTGDGEKFYTQDDRMNANMDITFEDICEGLTIVLPGQEDSEDAKPLNVATKRILQSLNSDIREFVIVAENTNPSSDDFDDEEFSRRSPHAEGLARLGTTLYEVGKIAAGVYLAIQLEKFGRKKS